MPTDKKNKTLQIRVSEKDFQALNDMAAQANISLSKLLRLRLARGNIVVSPDLQGVVSELYLIRRTLEKYPNAKIPDDLCGRIDTLCQYCGSLRGRLRTFRV